MLQFTKLETDKKTDTWAVYSSNVYLGTVKWYAQWRRYTFFPDQGTLFDSMCLSELAAFCARETQQYKEERVK